MTLIAPGFLYAAMAVAAVITALHFFVTRQPQAAMLPTARFVPNLPATATSHAARPSDLFLLLLRLLLVIAMGTALARPALTPSRAPLARLILADVSGAVRNVGELGDSVGTVYRKGDVLIAFDSAARRISSGAADTVASLPISTARGNLSVALVSAIRAGGDMRERADSIELVIVSPFAAEEWNSATDTIRKLWPGRARIIHAGAPAETVRPRSFQILTRAPAGDPMHVSATLSGTDRRSEARLIRDEVTDADAQWAATANRVLVAWPAEARPPGAVSRTRQNVNAQPPAGGVVAGSTVVIAAFERQWIFPADSIAGAHVVARWIDGEPAAIERQAGDGCVRSVAIAVTHSGDLAIRAEFVRIVTALTGPCVSDLSGVPLVQPKLATLAGNGGFAPREAFNARADGNSLLAPWLFGLAIAAAVLELFVRGTDRAAESGKKGGARSGTLQKGQP